MMDLQQIANHISQISQENTSLHKKLDIIAKLMKRIISTIEDDVPAELDNQKDSQKDSQKDNKENNQSDNQSDSQENIQKDIQKDSQVKRKKLPDRPQKPPKEADGWMGSV